MTNSDRIYGSLSPRRIRNINRGLTNPDSVYFTKIKEGPKVRYLSLIDLALMFNNSEVCKIFRKRINLETAVTLLEAAEKQNSESSLKECVIDNQWREGTEKRINFGRSYSEEYDLGRFVCRLSKPTDASPAWWVWDLNEYYNNLYGYSVEINGKLADGTLLEPSFQDSEVIVFDRPTDLSDDPQFFTLKIRLNDDTSSEEIEFEAPLPFTPN